MTHKHLSLNKYNIIFTISLLFWLTVITPQVKRIMGLTPLLFPVKPFSAHELIVFILASVFLSGFSCFLGVKELRKTQDYGQRKTKKKILPIAVFLFFTIPIAYAFVYELDINNLTQTIINELLIDDDFDDLPPGSDPPGWNPVDGNWTTVIDEGGNIVYIQDDEGEKEALTISAAGNASWANYIYETNVKFEVGNPSKLDRGALLLFRYQGGNNYYYLWLKEGLDEMALFNHGSEGAGNEVNSTSITLVQDIWYHFKISIVGEFCNVWVDGVQYFYDEDMASSLDTGQVGIGTRYYQVKFDNIEVNPI